MRTIFLLFILFYNCFTEIKIPTITFTQTQTAAERQMIGGDKTLENNGWLISSIRSSAAGSEEWQKESEIEIDSSANKIELYGSLRAIAYYAPQVKSLKSKGIIGESLKGELEKNPLLDWKSLGEEYQSPTFKENLEKVIKEVNSDRKKIYTIRVENESKKSNATQQELKHFQDKLRRVYYNTIESGEFYEVESNKWVKKD